MLVSSIGTLLLLGATLSPATAVPTDATYDYRPFPTTSISLFHQPQNVRGSFARLRDSLIHRIWGVPPRRREHQAKCNHPRPKFSAPANFRSKYSGDVVLRFKITSEEEAKSLAEVSDILYLDVWESTQEWVDIRLARDVIPSVLSLLPPSLTLTYVPLMHDLAQTIYESYPSHATTHEQPSHRGFMSSLHGPPAQSGGSRRTLLPGISAPFRHRPVDEPDGPLCSLRMSQSFPSVCPTKVVKSLLSALAYARK